MGSAVYEIELCYSRRGDLLSSDMASKSQSRLIDIRDHECLAPMITKYLFQEPEVRCIPRHFIKWELAKRELYLRAIDFKAGDLSTIPFH